MVKILGIPTLNRCVFLFIYRFIYLYMCSKLILFYHKNIYKIKMKLEVLTFSTHIPPFKTLGINFRPNSIQDPLECKLFWGHILLYLSLYSRPSTIPGLWSRNVFGWMNESMSWGLKRLKFGYQECSSIWKIVFFHGSQQCDWIEKIQSEVEKHHSHLRKLSVRI